MEMMGTYIGAKYGDKTALEWTGGKKITPSEPAYSHTIKVRHAARVKVTTERIE